MTHNLKLTNSLTRKKELFKPINPKSVTMYACGPTVYDDPHVGNARTLVVFDTLFRVLKKIYEKVNYVRNITDVDDKIIEASKKNKKNINEITEEVTKIFHQNCKSLNCLKPTMEPKATGHINEMVEMTKSLIEKNFAYEANGHVYFSVSTFKNYGALSNKNLKDLKAGSRIEVSKLKKNPMDFVLWKPSAESDPGWESPWGKGRPGWHLECSAMSKKFLGNEFDIHGGGIDLIFPHHENEIAQSRCANDTKVFANYWLHNAFITMSNEKMAKSQGNILKIKDFRNKVSGQVLRLALISAHYKQPLDWSDKLLTDCQNTIDKWYNVYLPSNKDLNDELLKPLYDDINTPGYIANLHQLYDKANKGSDEDKKVFNSACNFIGLLQETKEEWLNHKKVKVDITEDEIKNKINLRNKARLDKDYKEADNIRDYLLDKGVLIEDKDGKTIWKFR